MSSHFFSAQHMKKHNKFLNHRKLENMIYALSRYAGIWKTPMDREGLLRSALSCMNSMNKKEIVLTLVNLDIKDNIWTTDNLIMQKYAESVNRYRIQGTSDEFWYYLKYVNLYLRLYEACTIRLFISKIIFTEKRFS